MIAFGKRNESACKIAKSKFISCCLQLFVGIYINLISKNGLPHSYHNFINIFMYFQKNQIHALQRATGFLALKPIQALLYFNISHDFHFV